MIPRIALLLSLARVLIACEPEDLIRNPLVDRWCGDRPCSWEVDGRIERVGTWHSHDYAVALVSDRARLHQLSGVSSARVECLSFSALARVERDARAFVELDFLDDGHVDYSRRIPESDFEPFSWSVTAPTWFERVRFIVRKDGPGEVVLARIRALATEGCGGAPILVEHRASGTPCERDSECESGLCERDIESCDAGAVACEDGGCEPSDCERWEVLDGLCE